MPSVEGITDVSSVLPGTHKPVQQAFLIRFEMFEILKLCDYNQINLQILF